ncbi:MAG: nucleotidyltransferase domain-containing protein [Candidatus Omnitrophica bacterium]|nr:nucleotidyltransferase domain-containing protein [Candidatus Omnitrophota bacterium]
MQEIGRILGKKPGNFQRVINNMEKEGVVISERRANARYFKANKDYPLYEEVKNIVFKTVGIVGSIKDVLKRTEDVDYAFIYGSYAKAKENYLSDIDLVVIGDCDEDKLIKDFDRLEELLKREINYKLYLLDDFKKNIKQKEPFLSNIVHGKKIMLIGYENDLRKVLKR